MAPRLLPLASCAASSSAMHTIGMSRDAAAAYSAKQGRSHPGDSTAEQLLVSPCHADAIRAASERSRQAR